MKRVRITIGNKILGGFLFLILFFVVNAVLSIYTIQDSGEIISRNKEVVDPSVNALNELKHMVTRSKMLITNWVNMARNESDQKKLDSLLTIEYDALQIRLKDLAAKWEDKKQKAELDSLFGNFETVKKSMRDDIMNTLVTFEDYEDPMIKFLADEKLTSSILPQLDIVEEQAADLSKAKLKEKAIADEEQISSFNNLQKITIILGAIITIIGLILAFYLTTSITKPIAYIKEIVLQLSRGELPEDKSRKFSNDEVGEMALAVDKLMTGLRSTSLFAEGIGKGNYNISYEPLSESDVLGNSLIEMRNNLKTVAEQDNRRNWATEGLAKFGEILRKNNDNITDLSDIIISNLVKYMKANQGGLYVVNNENENDPFLEMSACYAWDKKKYVEQRVAPGDGLTGQAWLEKETIYLTDIPENYITITSGLGEANPTSVLIVPLKVNEEVYGLIEIASFNLFEEYEIQFIEKIAESIASTLSSVKINERTQKLLVESQELTEQMRSQEEEMRQNMEELQATQEEMQRAQEDRQAKETIISSTNIMLELNDKFQISVVNNMAVQVLGYREDELRSMALSKLVVSKETLTEAKQVVEEGHSWSGILKMKNSKGEELTMKVSAGKLRDPYNNSHKYLFFAANISQVVA